MPHWTRCASITMFIQCMVWFRHSRASIGQICTGPKNSSGIYHTMSRQMTAWGPDPTRDNAQTIARQTASRAASMFADFGEKKIFCPSRIVCATSLRVAMHELINQLQDSDFLKTTASVLQSQPVMSYIRDTVFTVPNFPMLLRTFEMGQTNEVVNELARRFNEQITAQPVRSRYRGYQAGGGFWSKTWDVVKVCGIIILPLTCLVGVVIDFAIPVLASMAGGADFEITQLICGLAFEQMTALFRQRLVVVNMEPVYIGGAPDRVVRVQRSPAKPRRLVKSSRPRRTGIRPPRTLSNK